MSTRRRVANNKSRRSRGPRVGAIDLDDLDGSLRSAVLGENTSSKEKVKVTIDSAEERRFVMHSSSDERSTGIFASANKNKGEILLDDGFTSSRTCNYEKHQENFSATKYIKPWRTGTKSQVLPPKTGHKKNSGKGGKTYA